MSVSETCAALVASAAFWKAVRKQVERINDK